MMDIVYLSLGSNLNNPIANLQLAINLLQVANIKVDACSRLYKSQPVGPVQADFYNLMLRIRSNYNLMQLLSIIKRVEVDLGRQPQKLRWGPRVIDIDIIYSMKEIYNSKVLTVPHIYCWQRLFVLHPWLDVCNQDLYAIVHKASLTADLGKGEFLGNI